MIALRANTEIIKVDIETGKPLGYIKSGSLESIFYLDDTHIFADKVVGRCCVIDVKEMCIQKKYSPKAINPAACLSCVITSAVLKNNTVTISGMEQYPKKALADLPATATIPFVRVIEHNFTEISAEGGQG